ncbi:MAG: hypothetical protein RLZZ28_1454 [Bacteroidota bacterium]
MNKAGLIFIFCMITCYSIAQTISNDRLKEIFRNQQLIGTYRTGHSLSINANQIDLAELDSALESNLTPIIKNSVFKGQFLPASLSQQYNAQLPYEWNQSSMIPAKGYQVLARVGVHAAIGKHISIQLAPEFVYAANNDFEGFSGQLNDRAWADRYRFWNTSDIPERFGNDAYTRVFAGQSYIRYNTRAVSFGISTESMWWGPGYRNSLIMSTNAPGFLHATINTIKPIHTGIGSFEGQIIGGQLQSSGFLPPRIYSIYNAAFVYQPKLEKDRYVAGMVLTWNPKWTPGLYLGISKASYLYTSDIANPLDVLPLQGFFGRARTKTEKNGTKASLGSLFIRYVMPAEKAELYMEYGRKDISLMPWNILQSDAYRRAYVAGFRKLFHTKGNAHIQLVAELTQMQAPTAELIREPDSWYTHSYVRQGYTHLGKTIGAGIGPGSNSQTLELAWIKGLKKIGLQFERVRYNSDYYYYAFEYITDFRRHWVDISTTFKADWNFKNLLLSAQIGIVRSYNYQWLVVQVNPTDFFAPGNEFLNISSGLHLTYRF